MTLWCASRRFLWLLLIVWIASAKPATDELRGVLVYLSSALANGNPSDAMTVFSKSFPDRSKLADQFVALTRSYDVTSQIEMNDEDVGQSAAQLNVAWALTLTDRATGEAKRRTEDVTIRFQREGGKQWKIVGFDKPDLFAP